MAWFDVQDWDGCLWFWGNGAQRKVPRMGIRTLFILLSAPGDFTICCDITAMLLPENLCYTYENKANATIPAISIPEFYNMDITTLQSSQHRSPIERTRDPAFPGYHPPAGPVSFRFTCSLWNSVTQLLRRPPEPGSIPAHASITPPSAPL